jgi:Alpha/beta hydrolase domain
MKKLAVAFMATAFFPGVLLAQTPVPRVTGPLPATAASYPFGAADHTRVPTELKSLGYVEEEFIVSGTANVYDWPAAGAAVVRTSAVPYSTRVLIRRPADRTRFSGNAVVEMLNPSNLFDLNLGWHIDGRQMAKNGDAWVGITAKPVAVASLKTFDPKRYAALSWPNPLSLDDPGNCSVAGDSARTTENGLVWDINTQVGAWLKSRDVSNPLLYRVSSGTTHPVQHLYGWGYSQTGSFLYTYVNAIHPLSVKTDGKPMFDAYIVAMSSGPSAINQCAPPIPQGDPRRVMANVGVPVVRVMSGSDYLSGINARRPDSDTPPELYRNYEIAGSAHATPDELNFAAAPADITKAGRAVPPMSCNEGPRSRFPNWVAFDAILENLDRWVRTGTTPPRAENIRVENGQPVLDRFGNVTGGIRSPFVDVPTSTWFGNSTGESFCRIAGHEVPFDAARVKALYPTAGAYVDAVTKDVASLVAARYMTRADGDELIAQAKRESAK